MLKNKYQRLSPKEKKEARLKFYETSYGKQIKPRFNRLLIVSVILFFYATYLLIDAFIKNSSIWNYIASIIIYIFFLVFFIGRHKIIVRDVNNYLIKKK